MKMLETQREETGKKSTLFYQIQTILLLFLISMSISCLLTNTLFDHLLHTSYIQFRKDTGLILTIGDKRKSLLLYYFLVHVRVFFLLAFFSYTNVWKLYSKVFLCYTGMIQGILLTFCIHKEKLPKGILEYSGFLFPHTLILIPLYLFCFYSFQEMHEKLFLPGSKRKKRELLFRQFPVYLLALLLLFAASFFEAYVNLPLLQKIL